MIAHEAEAWEQVQQQMIGELRQVWEAAGSAEHAEVLEQVVREWRERVGAKVLEALCQRVVSARERAQVQGCCGQRMDHHSRRPKTVLTLLGEVRVWRRYYRCLECGASRFPADAWLGWKGAFSHHLQEAVSWQCSLLPYREALAGLKKLAGVELSVLGAERIVARWGQEKLELDPYAERVDQDLVIEIDGTKVHLEEGWREMKVASCFSRDCTQPEPDPQAVRHVAEWETAERFRDTLWQEALTRGVTTARAVAVLGDGAPWIWEMASYLFPYATQILDWYHLTEHLWTAAKVVYGEGKPETTALVKQWEKEMLEGRSEGVEAHLRALVAGSRDDADHTLRKCADYLQTHQARLRYHLFRAAGWPIGSGVVEGACKHVVGMRFKRQSTRWTKAGARAVLRLRLDWLNNRWERRCALMRQAA